MSSRLRRGAVLAALLVTGCGDELASFALIFEVSGHGAIWVTGLLVGALLPGVVFGAFLAKPLSTLSPRLGIAICGLAQVFICLVLALPLGPLSTVLFMFGLGVANAISFILINGYLPWLMDCEPERAFASAQGAATLSLVLGPLLGVAAYQTLGRAGALVLDALSFLAVVFMGLAVANQIQPTEESQESQETGHLAWPVAVFGGCMLIIVGASAGSDVAFVYLIRRGFEENAPVVYAVASAAWAVGMLVGAVAASRWRQLVKPDGVVVGGAIVGMIYLFSGIAIGNWIIVPGFLLGGFGNALFNVSVRVSIYRFAGAERAVRGFGFFISGANAATLLGMLSVTPVADLLPGHVYVVAGVGALLAAMLAGVLLRVRGFLLNAHGGREGPS